VTYTTSNAFEHSTHEIKGDGIYLVFEKILDDIYPFRLDKGIPNTLLTFQNSKEGIEIPLEKFRIKATSGRWRELYTKLVVRDRIINEEGDFTDESESKQEHPLCEMKKMIKERFNKYDKLSLKEIWNDLQKPPFGLYRSPLASFVFGLLMKEYSKALEFYNSALKLEVGQEDSWSEANTVRNIGGVYLMMGDNEKAMSYFNEAGKIAEKISAKRLLMDIYFDFSDYYKEKRNFKKAFL
jgi:tetratricopeptide (TPR) repeat protein